MGDGQVIRDGAGDFWVAEPAGRDVQGRRVIRCRHEMGYEVVVRVPCPAGAVDEAALSAALEAERRRVPAPEAA